MSPFQTLTEIWGVCECVGNWWIKEVVNQIGDRGGWPNRWRWQWVTILWMLTHPGLSLNKGHDTNFGSCQSLFLFLLPRLRVYDTLWTRRHSQSFNPRRIPNLSAPSRISQGHSLYLVWTLWNHLFLVMLRTNKQTNSRHRTLYPRRLT